MFISFEGLDGSGKTTQIERLDARLRAEGLDVVRVREPGGTAVSERIRALLLDPAAEIGPRAELLLFSAARAQVVDAVIRPALARGAVVLADRFFDSTTAYQGAGRDLYTPPGTPLAETLRTLNGFAAAGLAPDLTVYLRLDPAAARARRRARSGDADDRMEASGEAFFARVAAGYDALARAEPARVLALDAGASPEALAGQVWQAVDARRRARTDAAPRP